MLHKALYSALAKTALLAGFVSAAMFGANIAQAQPVFIAPPTIVRGPVVVVEPRHRPVVVRRHRVVRPVVVVPAPVYVTPRHARRGYYGHRPMRRDGRPIYRDGHRY